MVESVIFSKSFLQEKIQNFDDRATSFLKKTHKSRCEFTEEILSICKSKAKEDNDIIEIQEGIHSKREHTVVDNKCFVRISGLSIYFLFFIF